MCAETVGNVLFTQVTAGIRPRDNRPSFVLPSRHLQRVLWVASNRAQRDRAQAAQGSATPPSGARPCVPATLDTSARNRILPTHRVPVSVHKPPPHLHINLHGSIKVLHSYISLFSLLFARSSSLCAPLFSPPPVLCLSSSQVISPDSSNLLCAFCATTSPLRCKHL